MTSVDRALLLAEWSCRSGDLKTCPVCGEEGGAGIHGIDCAMDLALSERGFCTQVERDHARGFVRHGAATAPTLPPVKP